MSPALAECAHGRANNIQLIRLLASAAVVLFHSYALTDRWTEEPLWRLAPELNFGMLGVQCFFVISGFLVTQSWLARPRARVFVAARVLRIYPALIAASVFTVVLAGASSALPWGAFLADPLTLDFLWRAASGYEVREQLPGVFPRNPFPGAANGSLWTLPIELRLYLALGLAGVAGLLARRAAWTATIIVLLALFVWRPAWVPLTPATDVVRELALLFALGSLAQVWRDRIRLSSGVTLVAIAAVVVDPGGLGRGALFEPLLAYVLLFCAYHPRLQWSAFNRAGDYSYGLFVYSFPIQQTLVRALPGIEPLALFGLALPPALAFAALSWHTLEAPALALKSRFR